MMNSYLRILHLTWKSHCFSFRPRAYCLADSDEESSSAGSSEEDDAAELAGEKQVTPGAEGWAVCVLVNPSLPSSRLGVTDTLVWPCRAHCCRVSISKQLSKHNAPISRAKSSNQAVSTDGRKLLCSAFLCWEHRPPYSPSRWPVQRSLWHPDGVIAKAESYGTVPSILPEPRAGFCVWTLKRSVHIQHYTHADPADPVFPVWFFSLRTQLLFKPSFLLRVLWFVLLFFFPGRLCVSRCAILPSRALQEFEREFPSISFATSFLGLLAALIVLFCFIHLIETMSCNEQSVVTLKCLGQ